MENGSYATGNWNRHDVIRAADRLTHGGWPVGGGVSIWEKPIAELEAHQDSLWRTALTSAGIL